MFVSDFQERIYGKALEENGPEKAFDIIENWDKYVAYAIEEQENKELSNIMNDIIEKNKETLKEIYIGGDYFNNKDSYFSSSKDGFLQLENIASKEVFKTLIPYEDFKEYARANINNLAEILAYIDTSDIELMSRVTKSISIDQLENIVFE